MLIEIKPITKIENEWKPEDNEFFSKAIVDNIIEEEDLKNNMIKKIGVGFDSQTQTFNNVIFKDKEYKASNIFLVRAPWAQKNREYYFVYVTNKKWDTAEHVILSLKIDNVTSNYDLFFSNALKGEVYLERSNNNDVIINDTHSDICSNIENKQEIIEETSLKINTQIDTFVNSTGKNYQKPVILSNGATPYSIDLVEKGSVFVNTFNNKNYLSAYANSNVFKRNNFNFDNNVTTLQDVNYLLRLYSKNNNYESENWSFETEEKSYDFFNSLRDANAFGPNSFKKFITGINDLITNSSSKENVTNWATIPVIFDIRETSENSNFEIDLSSIFTKEDLKKHDFLHQEIFITIDKDLFSIPLNFIKVQNKKIYGVRIYENGFLFKFFYNKNEISPFYEIEIQLNNDLLDDAYLKWKRDLQLQYNSGLKTEKGSFSNLFQTLLPAIIGGGVSLVTGGTGWALGGLALSSFTRNTFSDYQQIKNEHYQALKIMESDKKQDITLSGALLNKILFNTYNRIEWGYFDTKQLFISERFTGFYIKKNHLENIQKIENFKILIKKPLAEDLEKINQDQEKHGPIINSLKIIDNIFEIKKEIKNNIFYWQGKINPEKKIIDLFTLSDLNNTLSKGVYIKLKE